MSIKRYIAEKDTTITDAYKQNQTSRGTNANMGASDVLEIFSIYGQITSSSYEKSRILVQFPINKIISDRNAKLIGDSGSCKFILKLSNASHSDSTPDNLTTTIYQVSGSWEEGYGLDMEGYTDVGYANWVSSSTNTSWTNAGGDTYSSSIQGYMENASDDLEVDITNFVESWISGSIPNNGLLVSLDSTLENNPTSYYTKKFFARKSEYFFKKPWIEARSNSSIKDKRNYFYLSSDLVPAEDNLNTLFLYNIIRGQLKNIPSIGTGSLLVSLYTGTIESGPTGLPVPLINNSVQSVTASHYSTGIYVASVGVSGNYSYLYDVWSTMSGTQLYTGSVIEPLSYESQDDNSAPEYIISMPFLKQSYNRIENARMTVNAKNRQWNSNIYHIAAYEPDNTVIENLYYKIIRLADNYEVISYGTGSTKHTLTSYDNSANYFDLDMQLFEPGYAYKIFYCFEHSGQFYELKDSFKFRVEK